MTIESIIGIISGVITIGLAIPMAYGYVKKQPLTELMNQLVDKKMTNEQHRKTLKKMNRRLVGYSIKSDYIQQFVLNDRGKEAVFMDICENNDIEPTEEICKKFLNADMKKFRADYHSKRTNTSEKPTTATLLSRNDGQTVYMSELLMSKFPESCKNLIAILEKHNVKYSFLKGTKDIWCRDYMPIQTESGRLVQFRYEPSYLKGEEWDSIRSDVREVCKANGLNPQFSDINLDGGNVLICDGRAIISDRIFAENPNYDKDSLIKELSNLLECEIIIIPAENDDMTGHADGMVRFVNRNTIIGNDRNAEYSYWRKGMQKVIDSFNLTYIDVPFFEDKDSKNPESAIGIYVNYLEVNDLIILPIFGREEDGQVVDIIRKTFPNKQIETINYNDVAKEGGLLNCTTWVVRN